MNWSALTKRQQQMVFGTVILAVAQVGVLGYFLNGRAGGNSDGPSAREALKALEEKLEEARLVMVRAPLVESQLEESIRQLEALRPHAPTRSDRYAWAYEYVSLRAVRAGVELDSLEEIAYVAGDEPAAADPSYEISLSTQCGFNQLVEFLWRIEQDNPLVRVKDVNVSASADLPDRQRVQVRLQWPAALNIERGGRE